MEKEAQTHSETFRQRGMEMNKRLIEHTAKDFYTNPFFTKRFLDAKIDQRIQAGSFIELWVWKAIKD